MQLFRYSVKNHHHIADLYVRSHLVDVLKWNSGYFLLIYDLGLLVAIVLWGVGGTRRLTHLHSGVPCYLC